MVSGWGNHPRFYLNLFLDIYFDRMEKRRVWCHLGFTNKTEDSVRFFFNFTIILQ